MVKLQAISAGNATLNSSALKKSNTLKPVFGKFEDRFESSVKTIAHSKSSLIGKFFGAMAGYFAATKVNTLLNHKLMNAFNIDKQKAIRLLKIGIVVLNALISILTIYGGSQTAGKVESMIRNAFTKNTKE